MTTASLRNCSKNTSYWFPPASNSWCIRTYCNTGNRVCKNFDQDMLTRVTDQLQYSSQKLHCLCFFFSINRKAEVILQDNKHWRLILVETGMPTKCSLSQDKKKLLRFLHTHSALTHTLHECTLSSHTQPCFLSHYFLFASNFTSSVLKL